MENFAVTVLGKLCEAVETTESHDLHGWIGGASKFTMPFILLEYVIRIASQKSVHWLQYNLPEMAQECTPEVTSRKTKFLTALREKDHWAIWTYVYM